MASDPANLPPGSFTAPHLGQTAEGRRVIERTRGERDWDLWGPYLSERQWGTVREDYSADGDAWGYLSHDRACSHAYRWGEDGLAGICDSSQRLCLALALWNGRDPMLKERLFGLTNAQGNHGEDCKELYYYLDATPSHSYLKMLYKYPQRSFPYAELLSENAARGYHEAELELIDTGAFDDNRYFDVFIEYAKAAVDDILMKVTVVNCSEHAAEIVVLPQLWFRNEWAWNPRAQRPSMRLGDHAIRCSHPELPDYRLVYEAGVEPLFCHNETHPARAWGIDGETGYFKDAFHDVVIAGNTAAANPFNEGTKAGLVHRLRLEGLEQRSVRLRLYSSSSRSCDADPFSQFEQILSERIEQANAFYRDLQAGVADPDERAVQRAALAGLIWSKQYYYYDVERWLDGDVGQPTPPQTRQHGRNAEWRHLNNADIISMPDKWEYPWYATWDLAFHCLPFSLIDADFAKRQLRLFTREWYMHPNGQLPAYEWDFSDVNPPVHAWATWRVFQIDREQRGDEGDLEFLESLLHKLMLNFTWWVNRKDIENHNVFQGGFLGLDNIGVFDRSKPLPTGGFINQSDGTSWMAMYSLNLMCIALELAKHRRVYEDIATKFFEHFLHIAEAMTNMAGEHIGLWHEEDQFYYDELSLPDGVGGHYRVPLRLRSLVGLIPLFAVETIEPETLEKLPGFAARLQWVLENKPQLAALVSRWCDPGRGERRLLSLLRGRRMKALLCRMLDPNEFLSDYGVRSLSKAYQDQPYAFEHHGQRYEVRYTPAESDSALFGGNSNWRGPIWLPVNYLIIESLQKFHHYYGDDFTVECPTGSGNYLTLDQIATELGQRLVRLFVRDASGRRPVFGDNQRLQHDPRLRDHLLFYEYFDGDTGRGVGASHQTGWTALVAKIIQPRRPASPIRTR